MACAKNKPSIGCNLSHYIIYIITYIFSLSIYKMFNLYTSPNNKFIRILTMNFGNIHPCRRLNRLIAIYSKLSKYIQ